MELLRKAASFSPSIEDLRTLYILYVRSIVEQSCAVWNSSLTLENINDLEWVQKAAVRLMLRQQKLSDRRNELCLKFAKKCTQSEKTEEIFPLRTLHPNKEIENTEEFEVHFARSERLNQVCIKIKRKPG